MEWLAWGFGIFMTLGGILGLIEGFKEDKGLKIIAGLSILALTTSIFYVHYVKKHLRDIKDFFESVLMWGAILLISLAVIALVVSVFKRVNTSKQRHREHTQRLLQQEKQQLQAEEEQELQRRKKESQLQAAQLRSEREKQEKEREYGQKLKHLEELNAKNNKIKEDITLIKTIVSGLSVFDDDFLEQQPRVLEYIDDVMQKGRA